MKAAVLLLVAAGTAKRDEDLHALAARAPLRRRGARRDARETSERAIERRGDARGPVVTVDDARETTRGRRMPMMRDA